MRIIGEGRLEVGIQLPVQAQSSEFAADWELAAGPGEMIRIARAADEAGLFYVGVCDHVGVPRRLADVMRTTWYDTVATLGLLAGVTERVRLLSHVYVPAYRHPLQVASAFATLDRLSGGRVVLGVGAGHVAEEFAAFGVDFDRRGDLTDEAITGIVAAFTNEYPEIDGPTWQARDLGVGPRPVQQPRPPVWVGGSTPRALRRVAEQGDGWLPQGTHLRDIPDAVAAIGRLREAAGRANDPLDLGANGPWVHVGEPDRDLGSRVVSGSAERIASVLHRYRSAGISHVQIGFPARSCDEYEELLRAFGRDVLPLLNEEA